MQSHRYRSLSLCWLVIIGIVSSRRFPSRRTWWVKQVTNDLHITGRLTETEMKHAKESGYKSFIALSAHSTRGYIGPGETDPLPSTSEAASLAQDIGMPFQLLTNSKNDSVVSLDVVREFTGAFEKVPKPAILYSVDGYSAAFVALMHYLNASRSDPASLPQVDIKGFFTRAGALGYSFGDDATLVSLVNELMGKNINVTGTRAPVSNPDWYKLPASWQIKPLYQNIYVSGQVQSNHLDYIKELYDVVVNMRRGVTVLGRRAQEEVVLLNIKDRTGTYDSNGNPVRQTTSTLEDNRIDGTLPNSYISPDSSVNYMSRNPLQFGDAVGYNETIERLSMEENGIRYEHFPVGGEYTYTNGLWEAYRDRLLTLGRKYKSILLQCRSGYRSSVLGMLLYGCLHGHNSTQALERANLYGYEFGEAEVSVVALVREVLDNPEVACQCKDPEICSSGTTVTPSGKEASAASVTMVTQGELLGLLISIWLMIQWTRF